MFFQYYSKPGWIRNTLTEGSGWVFLGSVSLCCVKICLLSLNWVVLIPSGLLQSNQKSKKTGHKDRANHENRNQQNSEKGVLYKGTPSTSIPPLNILFVRQRFQEQAGSLPATYWSRLDHPLPPPALTAPTGSTAYGLVQMASQAFRVSSKNSRAGFQYCRSKPFIRE